MLERPTLRSLGAYWIIQRRRQQERHRPRRLSQERRERNGDWRQGPPLFRVEKGAHKTKEHEQPAQGPRRCVALRRQRAAARAGHGVRAEAHALRPRRRRGDQDARRRARSASPSRRPGPIRHVVPGDGGGTRHAGRPVQRHRRRRQATPSPATRSSSRPACTTARCASAAAASRASRSSGAAPTSRGEDDHRRPRRKRAVSTPSALHDVWFEDLDDPQRELRDRRARLRAASSSAAATSTTSTSASPRRRTRRTRSTTTSSPTTSSKARPTGRAPRASKTAAACSSPARATSSPTTASANFGDAIDTMPSPRCEAIDFHNNDVDVLTDDGIEIDYSQRNVRVLREPADQRLPGHQHAAASTAGRSTSSATSMYNVCVEPFKMHNGPSGALMMHNTVREDRPRRSCSTPASRSSNCVSATTSSSAPPDRYAFDNLRRSRGLRLRLRRLRRRTVRNVPQVERQEVRDVQGRREKAPVYKHAVHIEDPAAVFASGRQAAGG